MPKDKGHDKKMMKGMPMKSMPKRMAKDMPKAKKGGKK